MVLLPPSPKLTHSNVAASMSLFDLYQASEKLMVWSFKIELRS